MNRLILFLLTILFFSTTAGANERDILLKELDQKVRDRHSPQTVYNNRTKVKSKARNKETFENDVIRIGDYKFNFEC
ncbi:hypothetical protein [Bacteroides sp. 51]|uniref:hypothetical protein n=1 Tax=Bacteroides sp. 51 TaxID=2302938 RepID=UPI0013D706F3|nr:hypothetical protein [Bacteroides sp. 51]NDV82716.1 hypothetical protein [Bacteroides sp. 51]